MSALAAAAAFVAGFWLYFALLMPAGYGSLKVDPVKHAAFLVDHRVTMYAWNLTIYVVFAVLLVIFVLTLYERLKAGAPARMQCATAFSLVWATLVIAAGLVANIGAEVVVALYSKDPTQAAAVWLSLSVVLNGLGAATKSLAVCGCSWSAWPHFVQTSCPRHCVSSA